MSVTFEDLESDVSLSVSNTADTSSIQYKHGDSSGYLLSAKYDDFESVEGSEVQVPQVPLVKVSSGPGLLSYEAKDRHFGDIYNAYDSDSDNPDWDGMIGKKSKFAVNTSPFGRGRGIDLGGSLLAVDTSSRVVDYVKVLVGRNSPYDEEISNMDYDSSSTSSSSSIDDSSDADEIDTIKYACNNNRGTPLKEKLPISIGGDHHLSSSYIYLTSSSISKPTSPSRDFQSSPQKALAVENYFVDGMDNLYSNTASAKKSRDSPKSSPDSKKSNSFSYSEKKNQERNDPIGTIITFNQDSTDTGGPKITKVSVPFHSVASATVSTAAKDETRNAKKVCILDVSQGTKNATSHQSSPISNARVSRNNEKNVRKLFLNQNNMDIVHELVMDVVTKADKYGRLQTSLGLVDMHLNSRSNNVNFIPGTHPFFLQNKKASCFVQPSQIQKAFLFSDLKLSAPQVSLLFNLVEDYAQKYAPDALEIKELKKSGLDDVIDFDLFSSPVLRKGNVNVGWLQSYLNHLRLQYIAKKKYSDAVLIRSPEKRRLPTNVSSSNRLVKSFSAGASKNSTRSDPFIYHPLREAEEINAVSATIGKNGRKNSKKKVGKKRGVTNNNKNYNVDVASSDKKLLDWDNWYSSFYINGNAEFKYDPKEFKKALSGLPHHLTTDNLNYFLDNFRIITDDMLAEEVKCRIDAWVYGLDGNSDFQDDVLKLISKWEKAGGFFFKDIEPRVRKQFVMSLKFKIIDEKTDNLMNREVAITRELFAKYNLFCTDSRNRNVSSDIPSWRNWFRLYLESRKKDLFLYRETMTNLRLVSSRKSVSAPSNTTSSSQPALSQPAAPLSPPRPLSTTLKRNSFSGDNRAAKVVPSSSSSMDRALQHNLIELQRAAVGGNGSRNKICQTQFEYFVQRVFNPAAGVNESNKGLKSMPSSSKSRFKNQPFASLYDNNDVTYRDFGPNICEQDVSRRSNSKRIIKKNVAAASMGIENSDRKKFKKIATAIVATHNENYYSDQEDDHSGVRDGDDFQESERRISYEEWLVKVSEADRLKAQQRAVETRRLVKEKEQKRKLGAQRYQDWLHLRAKNKYQSSVGGAQKITVSVPKEKAVAHSKFWDNRIKL